MSGDINDLIEASSLGTPHAQAIRAGMVASGALFEEALETVAREVIARMCEGFGDGYGSHENWEDYPDLAEGDFNDLVTLVRQIGQDQGPAFDQFEAAYALLAGRAEQ